MKQSRVTIIGLGLIGGSIAKALHDKLGFRCIIGVDTDKQALEAAAEQGIISAGFTSLSAEVYSSDIVFVCTPVKHTFKVIADLTGHVKDTCIITDTGSTKEEITGLVNSMVKPPCFIGGHPMAGTERSGFANSYAHLFENAYYILTPCESATSDALEKLSAIVEGMGAIPLVMSAREHDIATGGISHVPHVIAAALVNLVRQMDMGKGDMQMLAAGGFRDITRIASSDPLMWGNIVFSNKAHIVEIMKHFQKILDGFMQGLLDDEFDEVYNYFKDAGQFRDSISDRMRGLIQPLYRLIVDVRDEPGVIGEIAMLLGSNKINIKNINVSNSREFEQGCLIIDLSDSNSTNIAFDLLVDTGYKVYKNR